ncbi:acetylserotonin O-methyltransferase-like [Lissotriton helveticus]
MSLEDLFVIFQVMFTAWELGIFDLLQESGSPLSSATIAEHLHASADGMERLLCACVGLKLLETEMSNTEACYKNTPLSDTYLTKSSPKSFIPMMMYFSDKKYNYWNFLADAVREGTSQHEKACGISSNNTYEVIYREEDDVLKFMQYMDSICRISGRDVISAFNLSPFSKVCDLGGCSGALAKQFIEIHPNSTVTIFDLPKVVQRAKKHFISPKEHRIQFQEGDFVEDPIPESDLYILAQIVHCWKDDKCVRLLTKVYNSCKSGGGILLVEALLYEDKSGPLAAQMSSLNMLMHTEGKERTPSEYKKLLTAAGFRDIEVRTTGKFFDAILAIK